MTCPSSDEPAILSGISFFSYYKFLYQRKECILLCSHNCYSVTALNTGNGLGILVNKKGLPLSFFYEFAINHDKMHANAKKNNCPINDYLLFFFTEDYLLLLVLLNLEFKYRITQNIEFIQHQIFFYLSRHVTCLP